MNIRKISSIRSIENYKIFFKTVTIFGFLVFFSSTVTLANAFKKYQNDAQMECWGDNGQVLFIVKNDSLIMQSPDDIMSFKLGQNLQKNGDKLEFIAQAGFLEIYVNFENRTGNMMGYNFQCF